MTYLIIQIPAYNEEKTLDVTIKDLPKNLPGIKRIEYLVIDDGSRDQTVAVAKALGVHHVVSHTQNQGLAKTFLTGIDKALSLGADIIVNTDADNQYQADDIIKLVQPILDKKAEMVIGERPIAKIQHFSFTKKILQKLGSRIVQVFSKTDIQDAPSGFRAFSRKAAMRLNVFNDYTYTIETIIQAGKNGIPLLSVPIRTNADLRPSRLVKSIPKYIKYAIMTMIRTRNTYRPLQFFMYLGSVPFSIGFILCIRWVILFMGITPATHIPSLILAAILILIGIQLLVFGLIADLISVNRKILEDIQYRVRNTYYKN